MTFDETDGMYSSPEMGSAASARWMAGFLDTRINIRSLLGRNGALLFQYRRKIRFVPYRKALQKLGGLPISVPFALHTVRCGPKIFTKVVGIYDKLSRYDADEGVVIAYGSMYGNTEQMAEAIAAELSAQGIKNIVMHNVSKTNPSYILADIFRYKGLIVGSADVQQPDISRK